MYKYRGKIIKQGTKFKFYRKKKFAQFVCYGKKRPKVLTLNNFETALKRLALDG